MNAHSNHDRALRPAVAGLQRSVSAFSFAGLALILCQPAVAAPSLQQTTGSFAHGNAVSVTGSGFGSHTNYGNGQPFLAAAWNDFSSGQINGGNFALDGTNNSSWSLITSGSRPNRTYALRKGYANGNRLGAYSHYMSGNQSTWFTTFWFKLASPVTQSGKFWRIYGSSPDNVYLSTGNDGASMTNTEIRGFSESTSISPSPTSYWGGPDSFGYGSWHRVEILASNNPSSLFKVWMDGKLQFTKDNWVPTPFSTSGHTLDIGNMIDDPAASGGNNGAYIFSDVYFSYTQSRIEIGNAPTWNNCTVREIQIPTQWSANSVSFRVNTGAFSSGTTAYLYIVDATGTPSAGYPVVIGGSGSAQTSSPPAPTGLQVSPTPTP